MIALLQRVSEASVCVSGERLGAIANGLLVFACAEPLDTSATVDRLLDRLIGYRVFGDENGKMNLSLVQAGGGLLLVPQFTLAADTRSGSRPSFSSAAAPALAKTLFEHLVARARERHSPVEAGRFGADMQVALVNDGPVTFWLRTPA